MARCPGCSIHEKPAFLNFCFPLQISLHRGRLAVGTGMETGQNEFLAANGVPPIVGSEKLKLWVAFGAVDVDVHAIV